MIFNAEVLNAAAEFVNFLNTSKSQIDNEFEFLELGIVYNDGEEWVLETQQSQYEINDLPLTARIITFTKYYKGDKPYDYVAVKVEDDTGVLWSLSGCRDALTASGLATFINKVDDIKPVVTVLAW